MTRRETLGLMLWMLIWLPHRGAGEAASVSPSAVEIKQVTTQKVFDDLVRAIGDGRTRPDLRLLGRLETGRSRGVWYSPDRNVVTLEEQAYDLCASLKADSLHALAFLLGHELAHWYRDHGWVHDFGSAHADLGVGQVLGQRSRDPAERVRMETEADYFGGFFAHIAGYRSLEVAGEVLPRLYTAYGLGEDLRGYPSLPERQEIARRARQELDRMVPVFEAGRLLLLVKRYEEAARCFGAVARTFPSREILNNAGVARALEAVDLFDQGELEVAYPLELDAQTRLRTGSKASEYGPGDRRRLRRALVREARELFEQARQRDDQYLPGRVNLAAATDLAGEPFEALALAHQAVRMAQKQSADPDLGPALIVRGIARLHTGDEAGARQDFEAAEPASPALAQLNLAFLDDALPPVADRPARTAAGPETIDAATPRERCHSVVAAPTAMGEVPAVDRGQPAIDIYTAEGADWTALVVEAGYGAYYFLETRPGYAGQSAAGVRLGDGLSRVREAYGPASYLVAARQGTYHIYADSGMILHLDALETVQGWAIYDSE